jgi:hypothetical protein
LGTIQSHLIWPGEGKEDVGLIGGGKSYRVWAVILGTWFGEAKVRAVFSYQSLLNIKISKYPPPPRATSPASKSNRLGKNLVWERTQLLTSELSNYRKLVFHDTISQNLKIW